MLPPTVPDQACRRSKPIGRVVGIGWLLLGFIFVAIGFVGVFVPLLPTTIFIILAAGCFTRSSPRFEAWLLDNPRFGPTLRAWRASGAISPAAKSAACLGISLGYVVFLAAVQPSLGFAALVTLPLAGCAAFILTRPAPGS